MHLTQVHRPSGVPRRGAARVRAEDHDPREGHDVPGSVPGRGESPHRAPYAAWVRPARSVRPHQLGWSGIAFPAPSGISGRSSEPSSAKFSDVRWKLPESRIVTARNSAKTSRSCSTARSPQPMPP